MNIITLLLLGAGILFIWSGYKNKSPIETLKEVFQTGTVKK